MDEQASLNDALKEYRITPDTLWAVFYLRNAALIEAAGGGSVGCGFDLAGPGEEGAAQIKRVEERDPGFLGCFSLSTLEALVASMSSAPKSASQKALILFGLSARTFIIFSEGAGASMHRVETSTLEDAVSFVRKEHPDRAITFGGSESDLLDTLGAMRKIVGAQDFERIGADRRGDIRGFSAEDLLTAKKTPAVIPALSVIYTS